MKYTEIFGNNTLRDNSTSTDAISHALLTRGSFIRSLGAGFYAILPMGMKVAEKIKAIIKEELDALSGQEIDVPMIVPKELWQRTNRDKIIGNELISFKDKRGHSLVISSSHIEAVTQLAKTSIDSYRDFPRFVYQFNSKFRDEDKIKHGMYRSKEFLLNDAFSFHRSYTDLNNFFPKIFRAYKNIFEKCGIEIVAAPSAVGSLSGDRAYEFLMECKWGDNTIMHCPTCGYKASGDVAIGIKTKYHEKPKSSEVMDVPVFSSPKKLSKALNIPLERFAFTELYKTLSGWHLVLRRLDYQISLEKLSRFLEVPVIGLATKEEVIQQGFVPGFIFPAPTRNIDLVIDDSVTNSNNLIIGSGKKGKCIKNANFGVDFHSNKVGDITAIQGKDKCRFCRNSLHSIKAIEIGNIFNIGTFFSKAIGLSFLEEDGSKNYPYMGSYCIGIGRLMMAIVESNHDNRGIIWPKKLTPFSIFLMGIGKSFKVREVVENIASQLNAHVLFDDRHESIGVKFKDFELLGIPYRIVVSTKSLRDEKVEFYERKTGKTWGVPINEVKNTCLSLIAK